MITFSARSTAIRSVKTDALLMFVSGVRSDFTAAKTSVSKAFPGLSGSLSAMSFTGKEKESVVLFPGTRGLKAVILVGLGAKDRITAEGIRRAAARGRKRAEEVKARSLAVLAEPAGTLSGEGMASAIVEGIALSAYHYDKYLTEHKETAHLSRVELIPASSARMAALRTTIRKAVTVCEGTYLARDLANAPANEIYPETLARQARAAARRSGCTIRVFDERKIRSLGMGGLIGVSRGSERPPRFIILEHRTRRSGAPTVVLVGKGVTFDAGGISIKPAAGMGEMKMDMSGAAVVIGTIQSAAQLKLPVRLIGLIPATENLLGGSAMKPGDILTHYNGKTSEVDNTDAEGRLILADALSYAEKFKPDLVIDLATLTGACVVALGQVAAGMMGNDQHQIDRLREAGERTHEYVWQLPLYEEYERQIKSDVADVKNVGGRWAGAITAALFLRKFIGTYPWIHLDIAGPAILEEHRDYAPRGASGFGVRLLVDFLEQWHRTKR